MLNVATWKSSDCRYLSKVDSPLGAVEGMSEKVGESASRFGNIFPISFESSSLYLQTTLRYLWYGTPLRKKDLLKVIVVVMNLLWLREMLILNFIKGQHC